jgi:hypothetical protein
MQTGRDLVARDRLATGKGLVAFGGIDFGKAEGEAQTPSAPDLAQAADAKAARQGQLGAFDPLIHSGEEVDVIAETYSDRRSGEPNPILYNGPEATKANLKALAAPPRVLHLATHGFYLKTGSIAGQPLLQSGVALSGANGGLAGKTGPDGDTGILRAIEASGLNLFGAGLWCSRPVGPARVSLTTPKGSKACRAPFTWPAQKTSLSPSGTSMTKAPKNS